MTTPFPTAPVMLLVVESSPTAAAQLGQSLAKRFSGRVQVTATASATEAVRLVTTQPIDFVVANVHCGEGDGLALCQALRAIPDRELLPILLLGEQVTAQDKIAGFTSGADDFVVRPVDDRLLASRIELLWRIKRMEQLAPGAEQTA